MRGAVAGVTRGKRHQLVRAVDRVRGLKQQSLRFERNVAAAYHPFTERGREGPASSTAATEKSGRPQSRDANGPQRARRAASDRPHSGKLARARSGLPHGRQPSRRTARGQRRRPRRRAAGRRGRRISARVRIAVFEWVVSARRTVEAMDMPADTELGGCRRRNPRNDDRAASTGALLRQARQAAIRSRRTSAQTAPAGRCGVSHAVRQERRQRRGRRDPRVFTARQTALWEPVSRKGRGEAAIRINHYGHAPPHRAEPHLHRRGREARRRPLGGVACTILKIDRSTHSNR